MDARRHIRRVGDDFVSGCTRVAPWLESYRPADPAEFERTMQLVERGSFREAMHSDDLPIILGGQTDLHVRDAFAAVAQPWRDLFSTTSFSRFAQQKIHSGLYVEVDDEKGATSLSGRYPMVPQGGRYDEARLGEYYVTAQLAKYGATFRFTMEMLNDGLQAQIARLPQLVGRGMAMTLNYDVVQMLEANASTSVSGVTMADGYNLFETAAWTAKDKHHGNMASDALPLNKTNLEAQVVLFGQQKDDAGVTNAEAGIKATRLVVPQALEITALKLVSNAALITGSDTITTSENVLAGMKVVCLPGLSSSVDWFLAADASMGTAEVAFWNGMQSPELFVQNPMADLTVDDAIYKVRHVWDVYPLAYWTMRKVDDTTT